MCERNEEFVVLARSCGVAQLVGTDCGDALCPVCEPYRAIARRKGWQPVAEKMSKPMWSTMTLPNNPNPGLAIKELLATRRRFLNIRLGSRNRKRLVRACHLYALIHFGSKNKVSRWDTSVKRFIGRLEGFEKPPRMYDVMGAGFCTLEITYNPVTDSWHPHTNAITDSEYIPWVLEVIAWSWASDRRGKVVWEKRLKNIPKDMQEVVKYICKPWTLPSTRQDDLREALSHKRRIWPLGKAKPVKVKAACPSCGSTECACRFAGQGEILQKASTHWGAVLRVRYGTHEEVGEGWFVKSHGMWKTPEPPSLKYILRELTRHSETSPPAQVSLFAGRKEVSACPVR